MAALARACGVEPVFDAGDGRPPVAAPRGTLVAALAAMDVDASTDAAARAALARLTERQQARLLPRTLVARAGRAQPLALPDRADVWIDLEDGATRTVSVPAHLGPEVPRPGGRPLPADLPLGRHTLCVRLDDHAAAAPLIVAPARLPAFPARHWGLLAQLYSVLGPHSWGMGDLADLTELAQWAGAGLGADFVQVNPLHAGMPPGPDGVSDPSPYRPASRRFADPVHLRVEAVPEYAYLPPAARDQVTSLAARGAALRGAVLGHDALIDRDAVWALKREALEILHAVPRGPGREADYRAFCRREGVRLDEFALWQALAEVHGPYWRQWPAALRDPRGPEAARAARELAPRVELHRWLAWLTDQQLGAAQAAAREAGMAIGLIHDLAVGCHPDGADAWSLQRSLAAGISVGAPPDAFNARGQDWGLPPWRPDALADSGYAPYADLLRGVARHAGALRVDHVMGLFRLWWVPEGRPPTEGVYVRYDHDAMLGVLALEAARAGAAVIGEDLGTVEPGVREELADRGILGTSVLWFERDWQGPDGPVPLPPDRWRADTLATLTTHDLPSTAARLSGSHVELRHRLGLLTRPLAEEQADAEAEVDEWLGELAREGLHTLPPFGDGPAAAAPDAPTDPVPPTESPDVPDGLPEPGLVPGLPDEDPAPGELPPAVLALHRYLARTPARLVGVWLPDLSGDPRPQNLPGTSTEYPNWRLPVADSHGHPLTLDQLAATPAPTQLAAALRDLPDAE